MFSYAQVKAGSDVDRIVSVRFLGDGNCVGAHHTEAIVLVPLVKRAGAEAAEHTDPGLSVVPGGVRRDLARGFIERLSRPIA